MGCRYAVVIQPALKQPKADHLTPSEDQLVRGSLLKGYGVSPPGITVLVYAETPSTLVIRSCSVIVMWHGKPMEGCCPAWTGGSIDRLPQGGRHDEDTKAGLLDYHDGRRFSSDVDLRSLVTSSDKPVADLTEGPASWSPSPPYLPDAGLCNKGT